ncbi:hypothetical protein [Aquiflexum gelatinilyticum]|uniref:hypothetical protein n=1 Tax=Aquiflexum gelatinilyticum TaxID=2961943 RepID=UPI0021697209|nr:hypothetical protein [Aquiflexum gelatinilyticum]MCS4434219.1 hypothetical protein [Aquiflexum gelatinilyticum]
MVKMKNDYDSLMVIPLEEYLELMPYLTFKKYPKNTVLKGASDVESVSRYLFEGLIGLFENREEDTVCRRIYCPNDTVCDFDSYLNRAKNNLSLITYTECMVAEFTQENEVLVIKNLKNFAELGLKINHRITSRDAQWKKLYWLEPVQRYDHLYRICPCLGEVKIKDVCGILNLPERTVSRLRVKK